MQVLANNLIRIIKSLKSSYGEAFFNSLTLQLHQLIHADYTFIAKVDKKRNMSQTICLVSKGEVASNFEYSLLDTPCADVSNDSVCVYPERICQLYPSDQLLVDMNVEGYLGSPLHDSNGKVIGILVALYEKAIQDSESVVALFDLFSGRISAEIERVDKEKQLIALNSSLEDKVTERTSELSNALERLRLTQDKLIEQEKLASLGSLVAGVAHEINTPLGIAILSSSNIEEQLAGFARKVEANVLKKSELKRFISAIHQSEEKLTANLRRTANLVDNFKEIATCVKDDDLKNVNVEAWLSSLIAGFSAMFDKNNIAIELTIDNPLASCVTYPRKISQAFSNIISNIVMHAFDTEPSDKPPKIIIETKSSEESLVISIQDNGKGMPKEVLSKILEPFYTTKRGQGGVGLGLNIAHNIICNNLHGELDIESTVGKGTCMKVTLPRVIN